MPALRISILIVWVLFWIYWLASATQAKTSKRTRRTRLPGLPIVVVLFLLLHVFRSSSLAVHSPILKAVGVVVLLCGLGLAVWARIYLGSNWGMPMTQRDEPDLVTSGPYRFVRHPIYTGILGGLLGTSLASNLVGLIALLLVGAYFVYSARVEERAMIDAFPDAYPTYRAQTKMLIPFVL
jgi:protein-S-isoprenylcysteine O-methyltransferase Ste14